jgi:signal transduction histidine kinase/CheY-like chemotaxis protein/HPt (histidine-containing phosphotransfer) domain-containing protein
MIASVAGRGRRLAFLGALLTEHIAILLGLLVLATTAATFWYVNRLQEQLVTDLAEQGARLQSESLEELRSLYTSEVVEKVRARGIVVTHDFASDPHAIPLPATLTIELGKRIGVRDSGMQVRLFSAYPFPWRKDGGPQDAFEREALTSLSSNPAKSFVRVESFQGRPAVRYAVADVMRTSCVACHNSHPSSPKTDWKVGDVRGVLEVTRPIAPVAVAAQESLRNSFALILGLGTLCTAAMAVFAGKQRRHARGLSNEIAERKAVEAALLARGQALELARNEANEASQAKSSFLAKMSHEIRTPMNGVLGMTELLLRTELSAKQQRFVHTVHSSGENLLSIIDDILDFSKIEAGKLVLEVIVFDLRQMIDDVVALFADGIQRKAIEFTCRIGQDVPQYVSGDPVRLRQILTNLLNNATKFTERGEIAVDVSWAGPGMLCLSVADTGIGMTPEAAAAVFQPFRQADSTTSRKYGGTGLGLAIIKQLAELMGGTIHLQSAPGQGSTFAVTVGLAAAEGAAPPPAVRMPLGGLRVLIVDDSETSREIVRQYILDWQMAAARAVNGAEALAMLDSAAIDGRQYDLAIIDMRMPVMDGVELVRIIKTDARFAAVKVIMMSSLDASPDISRVLALGVEFCLTKPIRTAELRNCIAALCGLDVPLPTLLPGRAPPPVSDAGPDAAAVSVLLVEDNAINQEIALAMLEETRYRVTVAENGLLALAACQDQTFDVILMDCQMPEMDGFEASRRLRLRELEHGRRRMPIIALTANAILGDRELCLDAGMDDHLAKPYTRAGLLAALGHWVDTAAALPPRTPDATPSIPAAVPQASETAAPAADAGAATILDQGALQVLRALQRPGRPDVLGRIIDMFNSDAPRLLGEMKVAAAANNTEAVRLAAHTLKSTCTNVGAVALSATCREIEQYARANDVDGALTRIGAIQDELDRVLAALVLEKEAK